MRSALNYKHLHLKSVYHHVEIRNIHCEYLGLVSSVMLLYITVLIFGLACACFFFLPSLCNMFVLHLTVSTLEVTQCLALLGYVIDTGLGQTEVPQEKIASFQELLRPVRTSIKFDLD